MYLREKAATRTFLIAEDLSAQKIVGVIAWAQNHITSFFVAPGYAGKGIGRLLFAQCEADALKQGFPLLVVESTPYAEPRMTSAWSTGGMFVGAGVS
jgi:GNAT superfamily N-acetyltransferase